MKQHEFKLENWTLILCDDVRHMVRDFKKFERKPTRISFMSYVFGHVLNNYEMRVKDVEGVLIGVFQA